MKSIGGTSRRRESGERELGVFAPKSAAYEVPEFAKFLSWQSPSSGKHRSWQSPLSTHSPSLRPNECSRPLSPLCPFRQHTMVYCMQAHAVSLNPSHTVEIIHLLSSLQIIYFRWWIFPAEELTGSKWYNQLNFCHKVQKNNGRKEEGENRLWIWGREEFHSMLGRQWQNSTVVKLSLDNNAMVFILSIQFNKHAPCLFLHKAEIMIVIYLLGFLYRLNLIWQAKYLVHTQLILSFGKYHGTWPNTRLERQVGSACKQLWKLWQGVTMSAVCNQWG